MSGLLLLGAGSCTLICGVLFYLASRHQCLFTNRPNARLCLSGAMAMGGLALFMLRQVESTSGACFMVVLLLMVVCSFFPLFMVLLRPEKKHS